MTPNRPLARFLRALAPALLLLVLAACRQPAADAPTPAPDPTTAPTTTPAAPTPGPAADAWAAIQARGRLVVGTSADYPPFATYTPEFELTGYDVALAQLIGQQLGVEVELVDMAFDGLGGALQVGQLDAAIAAISVTEQRQQLVDFSTIYHVSEGAALARADFGAVVSTVDDLAAYRVAVQDGSVFQTWLQETGVDSGVLPAVNVLAYTSNEGAIDDLVAGRVDVVIADRLPLEVAARDRGLAVVGRGLNAQRLAVGLPKGSNLTPRINAALATLHGSGALAQLAERYLSLDEAELVPLPTPEPATPMPEAGRPVLPAAGCIDAMALVAHLSLDDDEMRAPPPIAPATPFEKTWRIQNIGTCTWGDGYTLTPVGGNVPAAGMGGRPAVIPGPVAPGQTVDVSVALVAPLVPGVYQGFWSMRGPGGLLFGERIWVGVTVVEPDTPTPAPTVAPSASISFTANRDAILAGECVVFTWDVRNAAQVYFYAQGQPWQLNNVPAAGTVTECPNATTTFDLRVVGPDGAVEIRSTRVAVTPAPNAPFILFFTTTPSFQITTGQCVDVRWQVDGDVSLVRVSRNGQVLWDGAPLNGTSRDCPPVGEMGYLLEVSGPGGSAQGRQNVTVLAAPTPILNATATPVAPTPPPGSQPPVINAFAARPGQIAPGECVSVIWSAGGSVDKVQIMRNGVVIVDFAVFSGSLTDCLSVAGTFTYRVEATNNAGQMAFQQGVVTVGSGQAGIVGGWRLTNLNGAAVIPGTELTAIFGDGGNLSGSAGCNTYSGAYQLNGTSLTVGALGGSSQFCPAPAGIMEQEQLYLLVMGSATGYTVEGAQLSVRSSRGQLTFTTLVEPR